MKIVQSRANGAVVADVPADNATARRGEVRAGARRAAALGGAAAQEAPRRDRGVPRAASSRARTTLARMLTSEVGKPIAQSRNELKGLLGRHRLLPRGSRRARCATRTVLDDAAGKLEERISHEPLGVDRQHLGVELPVLRRRQRVRAGAARRQRGALQAVRVRDADRAGRSREMLHAGRRARGRVRAGDRRRRRRRGAAASSRSTACSSPARTPPAQKIAAAAGRRMIKVQLELGGKDPIYVCDDVDVEGRRGGGRRRRVLQHRPELLLGRAHLRAPTRSHEAVRRRVRRRGEGLQGRRPARRGDLHRPAHAPAAARRC